MRLNHADVVLDLEGEPMKEAIEVGGETVARDMTFRSLVFLALNNTADGERMGAEDKARCYQLSAKFFKGKFATLTVDEAAFIKHRGGAVLTALAYGRLCDWLEGNPQAVISDADDQDDETSPPSGGKDPN